MKLKSIILGMLVFISSMLLNVTIVRANDLLEAGKTSVGTLYVNAAKTEAVQKNGAYYLVVYAEEKYTDKVFLEKLRKNKILKDVASTVYLYLFDNRGSSYCTVAKYLIDKQGKVCLDYGSDMQMKQLTAKDKTMLNAYTLCLKALENKKRLKVKSLKK